MSKRLGNPVSGLLADRQGVSAMEYALIAALLSIMLAFVSTNLGGDLFILMVNIASLMHIG